MRYRPDLDGLRALAVLAVFVSHSEINRAAGGWVGVDVFFVLSGYLITALLLREREHTGQINLGAFYTRRALRLYPALITLLIVGLPVYRDLGDGGTLAGYGRTAAAAGLYVEDFMLGFGGRLNGQLTHTWTLAVEEQFYLLWPLALLLLLRRSLNPIPWLGGGVIVSSVLLATNAGGTAALSLPWTRCSTLLLGCLAAVLLDRRPAPAVLLRVPVGWLLALALVAVMLPVGGQRAQEYDEITWMEPLVGLFAAGLLLHLAGVTGGIRRVLAWQPLPYLGRRSYGIYLYHFPVIVVLRVHVHAGKLPLTLIELGASLALALLSYRFIEQPFLRLKHRRFEPPSHRPEPVPT